MNKPPTEKQLARLTALKAQCRLSDSEYEEIKKSFEINAPHRFSSIGASNMIQHLIQLAKQQPDYGQRTSMKKRG